MTVATQCSERELVSRAAAGDQRALHALVRLHEHRIAGLCRSRLRSREDAADAVQETFARALSRLDQLKDPDAFGPWLRTIAVRVCADLGRELSKVSIGQLVGDTADDRPPPDELAEAAEDRGRLHRALEGLGERDRQALWLRHGMEAPVSTVAAELGLTEGSARVLLTRARHRLRAAASGMAALFPPSWRHWSRTHLATLVQRPDVATAVAPLAAIAALLVILPIAGPVPADPAESARLQAHLTGSIPDPVAPEPVQVTAPATHAPTDVLTVTIEDQPQAPAPGAPTAELPGGVRVQEGYPEDEEYLVELRVISGGDAATVRLYGDPLDDPTATAGDSVAGLLGD